MEKSELELLREILDATKKQHLIGGIEVEFLKIQSITAKDSSGILKAIASKEVSLENDKIVLRILRKRIETLEKGQK